MRRTRAVAAGGSLSLPVDAGSAQLLGALLCGESLETVVPRLLAVVEREPLASAGRFRGDVLRGLMEVPGSYWTRQPQLYQRYRHVVRAAASLRLLLPPEERMRFWEPLDQAAASAAAHPRFTSRTEE